MNLLETLDDLAAKATQSLSLAKQWAAEEKLRESLVNAWPRIAKALEAAEGVLADFVDEKFPPIDPAESVEIDFSDLPLQEIGELDPNMGELAVCLAALHNLEESE